MSRFGVCAALLTTICLLPVRAQQANPDRLRQEHDPLLVRVDGKVGFVDVTGRMVIPPTFEMAWPFSEGRAAARQSERVGFIDRTGRFVISPRFEYSSGFREGLAAVRAGKQWGFVGPDGQFAIQPQFDETHGFCEDFTFDRVQLFSEGLAAVRVGNKWGFIDRRGTLVIAAEFEDGSRLEPHGPGIGPPIWSFSEGLAAVYKDGRWQFIDKSGRAAIAGSFAKVGGGFRNGIVTVCGTKTCGYIDRTGRVIWQWE